MISCPSCRHGALCLDVHYGVTSSSSRCYLNAGCVAPVAAVEKQQAVLQDHLVMHLHHPCAATAQRSAQQQWSWVSATQATQTLHRHAPPQAAQNSGALPPTCHLTAT